MNDFWNEVMKQAEDDTNKYLDLWQVWSEYDEMLDMLWNYFSRAPIYNSIAKIRLWVLYVKLHVYRDRLFYMLEGKFLQKG